VIGVFCRPGECNFITRGPRTKSGITNVALGQGFLRHKGNSKWAFAITGKRGGGWESGDRHGIISATGGRPPRGEKIFVVLTLGEKTRGGFCCIGEDLWVGDLPLVAAKGSEARTRTAL